MLAPDHSRRQHLRGDSDRPRNRGVIILPNGFTLMSLFFGMFAIVAASRSEFDTAGLYVVFAGICDALDGRVARATGTGSRFGSELDSLVDAGLQGFGVALAGTGLKLSGPACDGTVVVERDGGTRVLREHPGQR